MPDTPTTPPLNESAPQGCNCTSYPHTCHGNTPMKPDQHGMTEAVIAAGRRAWVETPAHNDRDLIAIYLAMRAADPERKALVEAVERALAIAVRDYGPDCGNADFFRATLAKLGDRDEG